MSTTEDRIEFLEEQVRQLREANEVRSVPDVIQAKQFQVVNDEGKVLVSLSNLQGGGVENGMIETRISTGGLLAQIGAGPGGGGVRTENGKGQALVELGSTVDGGGLESRTVRGGHL